MTAGQKASPGPLLTGVVGNVGSSHTGLHKEMRPSHYNLCIMRIHILTSTPYTRLPSMHKRMKAGLAICLRRRPILHSRPLHPALYRTCTWIFFPTASTDGRPSHNAATTPHRGTQPMAAAQCPTTHCHVSRQEPMHTLGCPCPGCRCSCTQQPPFAAVPSVPLCTPAPSSYEAMDSWLRACRRPLTGRSRGAPRPGARGPPRYCPGSGG